MSLVDAMSQRSGPSDTSVDWPRLMELREPLLKRWRDLVLNESDPARKLAQAREGDALASEAGLPTSLVYDMVGSLSSRTASPQTLELAWRTVQHDRSPAALGLRQQIERRWGALVDNEPDTNQKDQLVKVATDLGMTTVLAALVKEQLAGATSPETLEDAWQKTSGRGDLEATRQDIVARWREQVRARPDPHLAWDLVQRGERLGMDLTDERRCLEPAVRLATAPDNRAVPWAPAQVLEVSRLLAPLRALPDWPLLVEWANQRWRTLRDDLTTQLRETLGLAQLAMESQRYDEAAKHVQPWQPVLADPSWRQELGELASTLETVGKDAAAMQQAKTGLEDLIGALQTNRLTFGSDEVTQQLVKLIDLPRADALIEEDVKLLQFGQQIGNDLLQPLGDPVNYVTSIERARQAYTQPMPNLGRSDVQTIVFNLRQRLAHHIIALAARLAKDLQAEAAALPGRSKLDPAQLLDLYRQARAVQVMFPPDVEFAESERTLAALREAVDQATRLLPALVKGVLWNHVQDGMRGRDQGWDRAAECAAQIITWHRGLAQPLEGQSFQLRGDRPSLSLPGPESLRKLYELQERLEQLSSISAANTGSAAGIDARERLQKQKEVVNLITALAQAGGRQND